MGKILGKISQSTPPETIMKEVIILSERGWQGARNCALALAKQGVRTSVLIKGRPDQEVREFIVKHDLIQNFFIFRRIFFVLLPFLIFYRRFLGGARTVLVDRKRAYRLCTRLPFGLQVYWIQEKVSPLHYELLSSTHESLKLSEILK